MDNRDLLERLDLFIQQPSNRCGIHGCGQDAGGDNMLSGAAASSIAKTRDLAHAEFHSPPSCGGFGREPVGAQRASGRTINTQHGDGSLQSR